MSKIGILITLSGKNISLEYVRDLTVGSTAPFPRGDWPMSLSEYFRGATPSFGSSFVVGLSDRIANFLNENFPGEEDFESLKTSLPVVVFVENDLPDSTIDEIKEGFANIGFGNVKVLRPDYVIGKYYAQNYHPQGVVTVYSDGTDLYISLSLGSKPGFVARKVLPGDGFDPRAEDLAKEIWQQVRYRTIDLELENEMDVLRRTATEFLLSLSSTCSEKEGTVRLSDGEDYYYFVSRSMVNNDGTVRIKATLATFLTEYGLADKSRSVLVLRGKAIGSDYLTQALNKGFGDVTVPKDSLRDAIIRTAFGTEGLGKGFNQTLQPKVQPQQPKIQPQQPKLQPLPPEGTYVSPIVNIHTQGEPSNTVVGGNDDTPEEQTVVENNQLLPIKLEAFVEKVKKGFMNKKSYLVIKISSPDNPKIPWHSVLCVQEKILNKVELQNVVKDYSRGDKLPFETTIELPLKRFPNAKRLRIYFKPHPDEPVGINNAYEANPCSINL